MSERPSVGIDLGTTNSVVAVFDNGEPRVLVSETGHSLIPSVIALADDGTLLVGPAARERSAYAPSVSRFKPWMGEDRLAQIGTSELSPVQLSALILEEMKAIAEASLGSEVSSAVITVPAWFREPQRKATIQAAELAGLKVDRIINEPTAAAIAWGLHQGEREANVLVLDLGGGTFDVTVVELFNGVVEVLSSVGDTHLGGEDFTDALVRLVEDQRGAPIVEATQRARLRAACERAKRALSSSDTVPLRWGPSEGMLVTKKAFEGRAAGLLGRMRQCVREALLQARLAPADIEEVLLVGGATRMPLVREFAGEMFPGRVRTELDPDHVVALGAAVQAALVARDEAVRDFVVTDVTPFSLGVGIVRAFKGTEITDSFDPILHRGTTIPTSRTARYQTTHPQQTTIRLEVFQGERRVASENQRLGELVVSELPVGATPDHRVGVLVRFTHDLNGLLEVEATVPATGNVVKTVIEQQPGALSDTERVSALQALSMLKRSPRELLPNRYALERGRRLFELLPFDQRATLDELLLRFEAALLNEDEAEVNDARRVLGALVDEVALRQGLELDPAES